MPYKTEEEKRRYMQSYYRRKKQDREWLENHRASARESMRKIRESRKEK